MRVLYLTSGFPYPLTSGRLRHYHLIRELARRHEVRLLSMVGVETDAPAIEEVERFASVSVFRDRRPAHGGRPAPERIRRVLGREDRAIQLAEAAAAAVAGGAVDVVVVTGRGSAPAIRNLERVPLVADLCDATSLNLRGRLRVAPPPEVPVLTARWGLAKLLERSLVRRADALLFASGRDQRAILGSTGDERAFLVANGVDAEYWQRSSDRLGGDVVFTGAMDYPPNVDAARLLIDVVMPLVWREIPDARLRIVGRDPVPALRSRSSDDRVDVTGFVDDVRPYLEGAAVFAAPLRFGAGIQNKVLEAMSMEVPTVATPLAAAGLATGDGSSAPIRVAGDVAATAAAIRDAVRAARGGLGPDREARRWVTERFSWTSAGRRLDAALDYAVATAGRGGRG